jgi:DNA-binding transcriptional regulator YiaG
MAIDLIARVRARQRLPEPPLRRSVRESAGVSQGDLAKALGVTRSAVSRWEAGHREPRGEALVHYVDLLELLRATR